MPEFLQLDELIHWDSHGSQFTPPARFAVIGSPVAHSKSPQMHNPALRAVDMDAQYIRVDVPPGRVREAFEAFRTAGFRGVNITIPHKLEAMESVDHIDPVASLLGAVNTLVIQEDGAFHGFNTDGPGVVRAVEEAFGDKLSDLRILILGAGGGAGRATAVQCALSGCRELILVNRTEAKAEALAAELSEMPDIDPRLIILPHTDDELASALPDVDLIINATSIGMKAEDPAPLPLDCLTSAHRLFDMVYRADGTSTPLITAAQTVGARWTDGLNLLLHQGALSFEHWHHRPAPLEAMRKGLLDAVIH